MTNSNNDNNSSVLFDIGFLLVILVINFDIISSSLNPSNKFLKLYICQCGCNKIFFK